MRELQALCLDIAAYSTSNTNVESNDSEINLMDEFNGFPENQLFNSSSILSQNETQR